MRQPHQLSMDMPPPFWGMGNADLKLNLLAVAGSGSCQRADDAWKRLLAATSHDLRQR
jgi:hypothetical protein